MFSISFSVDKKEYSKEFSNLNNINSFTTNLIKSGTKIDYNKCWIFKDDSLCLLINTITGNITNIDTLKFTDINKFDTMRKLIYDNLMLKEYYKFIVAAWGDILYLSYNELEKFVTNDCVKFLNSFNLKFIQRELDIFKNDFSTWQEEDGCWIQEGMRLKNYEHDILTQNVINNLLGINFKPLQKQLTVYRQWGLYSGLKEKNNKYDGWLSVSKSNIYNEMEKFILPIGFPVCETKIDGKNYADNEELIVRNKDLILL